MNARISDFAIGAVVIAMAVGALAWFLTRDDSCLDKARALVQSAPAVTARTGKVVSAGTSSWLSGQTARPGERSFYFLVKGERGTARAVVSADRAQCICRLESVH
ncbi:hypothetical protein KY495_07185 [Massilia sp. PAMC28688]|uniref:hypothetical protein n=1 Tax=Massilia sp. PAMC28688 TaxID=2861283 RepID=UPI001C62CBBC|nr:hypothetical protein [Massilia sp. PAMC28688]QYF94947.1 hypothetical protein KY495_07185 [Massilia sp. PAMC28688]